MLPGINLIKILTAATPIVASISKLVSDNNDSYSNRNYETSTTNTESKPCNNINITINNFYTISKEDTMEYIKASNVSQQQLLETIQASDIHFKV